MGTSNINSALGKAQPIPTGGIRSPRGKIDIKAEFEKIRGLYKDHGNTKANFLIIGPHGSGKTYGLQNAPAPVLVHSFDPGGTDCFDPKGIASGRLLPVTTFETENISSPTAFRAWEKEFNRLQDADFFSEVGTYSIDSFTRFSGSLMNAILSAKGRKPPKISDLGKDPDIVPEMGDYNLHQKTLAHLLAQIVSLPCNVIINGHLNIDKDETTGKLTSMVMMDGKKFAQTVPTLFNEVYFANSLPAGLNDRKYFYQLVQKGHEPARSRLRRGGEVLNGQEPQNIKEILKKAGYPYEDKELFV